MTTIRAAIDPAARSAIAHRSETLLRSAGAVREGHFLVESGRHVDVRVDAMATVSDPAATGELGGFLAEPHRRSDGSPDVDVVVAVPTVAAAVLAFETARQLGVRATFAPRLTIRAGDRVLVVDDVMLSDGSLPLLLAAVEAMDAVAIECVALVDLRGATSTVASPGSGRVHPLRALWKPDAAVHVPGSASCPGCAAGRPLALPPDRDPGG